VGAELRRLAHAHDFLLKRERIVVETKMTRDRLDQAKVVGTLVIDTAHYRQHPDCKTLV
jgi:hypothetical protein